MSTKEVYTLQPSIGGSFSFAWKMIFQNFLYLLVIVIIAGVIEGPFQGTFKANEFHFWMIPLILVGITWGFLVVPVVNFGEKYLFLKAMREEEIDLKELFKGFTNNYVSIILANLIVFALVILGFIMLVVPGIIVACRLAFVPYLVMDKNLEPMQAVEKSWEITKGHGWKVFFMAILSFLIGILGLMFCIVGIFVSLIWIHAAFATLYQSVLNQHIENDVLPIIEVHEE